VVQEEAQSTRRLDKKVKSGQGDKKKEADFVVKKMGPLTFVLFCKTKAV